jgi:regulator of replication initiation timing
MGRPTVSDETMEEIEEEANDLLKVPAETVSFNQKMAVLVEEYQRLQVKNRKLRNRVESLQERLDDNRGTATGGGRGVTR